MANDPESVQREAEDLVAKGSFSEAVRICRRALLSHPKNAGTRLLLGRALLQLGRFNEVRVEMKTLLREPDAPAGTRILLAESYYLSGDSRRAANYLREHLRDYPKDKEARHLLERVDGEEQAKYGTVERWFHPLAGGTVEYEDSDIEGEKTSITTDFDIEEFEKWQTDSQAEVPASSATMEIGSSTFEAESVPSASLPSYEIVSHESSEESILGSSEIEILNSESISVQNIEPVIISEEYLASEYTPEQEEDDDYLSEEPTRLHSGWSQPSATPPLQAPPQDAVSPVAPDASSSGRHSAASGFFEAAPTAPIETAPTRIREYPVESAERSTPGFDFPPAAPPVVQVSSAPPPPPRRSRGTQEPTRKSVALKLRRVFGERNSLVLLGGVTAAVIALGVGVLVYSSAAAENKLRATIHQVCDDGRPASLSEALRKLGEADDTEENRTRRARLLAMATFEFGQDHADEVSALLSGLTSESSLSADAAIARAYQSLAEYDADGATAALSVVATTGDNEAEIARARSLTAFSRGDGEEALRHASAAVSVAPVSSRHVSWLAILTALNGNAAAGIETLNGIPDSGQLPNVRVARARILEDSGSDPSGARSEAEAVLAGPEGEATSNERAWARLVQSRVMAGQGEQSEAIEAIGRARELQPKGDAAYYEDLVATLLLLRQGEAAAQAVSAMPERLAATARASLARAEVALLNGDVEGLSEALESCDSSGQADYLRGRLFEARDDWSRAETFYTQAEGSSGVRSRARARRAAIALRRGHPQEAERLLRPFWERGASEPEVAMVWIDTLLVSGNTNGAQEALRTSRAQFGDQPMLMDRQLRLSLQQGEMTEALELAERLVRDRPRDAALQVLRYRAAGAVGNAAVASDAFEAASQAGRTSPAVLIDLANAAQQVGDYNAMEVAVRSAERAGAPPERLRSTRGMLSVLAGGGRTAAVQLLEIPEESRTTQDWLALLRAYVQAEQDRDARALVSRFPDEFEAMLSGVILSIRAGSLGPASTGLEALAARDDLTPVQRARFLAYRAMYAFENGDTRDANRYIEEAIGLDARCSEAFLVRADIQDEANRATRASLQSSVAGSTPLPEAVGRLAIELGSGPEACRLAEQYLAAAPRGYDARDVRRMPCP